MKSIYFLFALLVSTRVLACNCRNLEKIDKEAIARAGDIFVGRILNIETNDYASRKIIFQIVTRLKTDDITNIEIHTGLGGADCGLNIKEGQLWYIFSYDKDGKSWAGLCGRSALLSEHSIANEVKKFNNSAIREYKTAKRRAKKEMRYIRKIVPDMINS